MARAGGEWSPPTAGRRTCSPCGPPPTHHAVRCASGSTRSTWRRAAYRPRRSSIGHPAPSPSTPGAIASTWPTPTAFSPSRPVPWRRPGTIAPPARTTGSISGRAARCCIPCAGTRSPCSIRSSSRRFLRKSAGRWRTRPPPSFPCPSAPTLSCSRTMADWPPCTGPAWISPSSTRNLRRSTCPQECSPTPTESAPSDRFCSRRGRAHC